MSAKVTRKNPNALKNIQNQMEKYAKKEIAVGFPEGKTQAYSGKEHHGFEKEGPISVPSVAAAHVYGIGVPRRNFMGMAKQGMQEKASPILKKLSIAPENEALADKIFEQAGLAAQSEVRKSITDLNTPPNSPRTIEKKGFNNPLIWTGHMRKSATYMVREKKDKK